MPTPIATHERCDRGQRPGAATKIGLVVAVTAAYRMALGRIESVSLLLLLSHMKTRKKPNAKLPSLRPKADSAHNEDLGVIRANVEKQMATIHALETGSHADDESREARREDGDVD